MFKNLDNKFQQCCNICKWSWFYEKMLTLMCITVFIAVFALFASAQTVNLGDIDFNGKVNASDARTVLRVVAKLEENLGAVEIGDEEIPSKPIVSGDIKAVTL